MTEKQENPKSGFIPTATQENKKVKLQSPMTIPLPHKALSHGLTEKISME